LLKLAQALTPRAEWEVKDVSTADLEKESIEQIQKKEVGPRTMLGLIKRAVFSPEYGNKYEHVHNDTLGIKGITGPDLEELVASIFGTEKLE
jgi:hypothetical protein